MRNPTFGRETFGRRHLGARKFGREDIWARCHMGARTHGCSAIWARNTFKRIFNQFFVSFFFNNNFSVCNDLIEEIKITKDLKVGTFLLQSSRTTETLENKTIATTR